MSVQVLVSSELTKGKISGAILQSGISCETDILYCPTLEEAEALGEKFCGVCRGGIPRRTPGHGRGGFAKSADEAGSILLEDYEERPYSGT